MEFIPGQCLFKSLPALAQQQGVPGSLGANGVHAHGDANGGASSGGMHANGASGGGCGGRHLADTAEDLGRLFTLDMLLGNADRLPCRELGWRGNPGGRRRRGCCERGCTLPAVELEAMPCCANIPVPPNPTPLQRTFCMRRRGGGRGARWRLTPLCSGGRPAV